MKITATPDQTWDILAYDYAGSEFLMDEFLKQNEYYYCDVVTFEGGEKIDFNNSIIESANIISSPWG